MTPPDKALHRTPGTRDCARCSGFEAQTERAFDNLEAALGHASGRWADVALLTIYVVGYDGSQAPVVGRRSAPGSRPGGCRPARSSGCRRWPSRGS